jgi:hypothetical protein
MYLETCKVSRKTPRDGKLQISATTYKSLLGAGELLSVRVLQQQARAALATLDCTCNKEHGAQPGDAHHANAAGGAHKHFFLESALLRDLSPGEPVRLDLDGVNLAVTVTRAAGA